MTQLQTPPRLTLQVTSKPTWEGDFLVIPAPAPEQPATDKPGKKVGDMLLMGKQAGANGELLSRLLVSLGPQEKVDTAAIRKAGKATAKWLVEHHVLTAGLSAAELAALGVDHALGAFCEGLLLGAFRFERHKSDKDQQGSTTVFVLTDGNNTDSEKIISHATAIVGGVNLAREWSHEPPNIINPVTLAERAGSLAAVHGLKCTVLGEKELAEMGAGAILSVGLGSKTPSQMIILEYPGHGAEAKSPPVVVVGKAITFDTGGYSLKPTTGMLGMKFDKCGGMTVLGIMQAVAVLDLPIPVVGIVAAAENMISSYAYRPNDIITSLSGKTIEIISTDAEGRMVLSDALTYAHTHYQPRAIIDLATLTGGVVVALGKVRAGLMSNDDDLADALSAAGERTQERLWHLPLDEDYFELIKGGDSDIKNSAGNHQASAIVGGTFLKQFVADKVPWAHIDIAGTATVEKGPGKRRSATGFGARLVVNYLEHLA